MSPLGGAATCGQWDQVGPRRIQTSGDSAQRGTGGTGVLQHCRAVEPFEGRARCGFRVEAVGFMKNAPDRNTVCHGLVSWFLLFWLASRATNIDWPPELDEKLLRQKARIGSGDFVAVLG